jgi:hypothetical protein
MMEECHPSCHDEAYAWAEKAIQECENNAPVLRSSESVNLSVAVDVEGCKEGVRQRLD